MVGAPPRPDGAIDLPLAKRPGARDRETMQVDHEEGQKALTHFKVLDRAANRAALLALWPRTGRTHQLRVHCAEIGCPSFAAFNTAVTVSAYCIQLRVSLRR